MAIVSTNTVASQVDAGADPDIIYEKVGFKPHSTGQHEYAHSTARFNVPCCGRRWGKSIAAGHRMTTKMFVPDSYNWIVGPTYKLGEKEFRITYQDFEKLGLLKHCRKGYSVSQGNMYIITPWNAHLECVSADKPDSLLGEGLRHAIMSETARHDRSTWEQYIEPALSDLRGSADFPSTPKGYNWYHGLWTIGQESTNNSIPVTPGYSKEYKSWTFPTWQNTVRFPLGRQDPEILRVERLASPHWFDQEYGASFTTMAGRIYDEFSSTKHVVDYVFDPKRSNYIAFDYGFANPFVALDIQILPDDTVVVWREYYRSGLSTMEHGNYLAGIHEYTNDRGRVNPPGYHIDGMWGDPRGADSAATLAFSMGHVASQDVVWGHGVEEIKRMLKQIPPKLLIDRSCVNLIRQMEQLKVKEQGRQTKTDISEMTGDRNIQHKVDDHAADALRYFIGPMFVLGAGAHLSDIYDQGFNGSESQDFMILHGHMTLDESTYVNRL